MCLQQWKVWVNVYVFLVSRAVTRRLQGLLSSSRCLLSPSVSRFSLSYFWKWNTEPHTPQACTLPLSCILSPLVTNIFLKIFILLFCVSVLRACMSMHHMCAGIQGGGAPPCECWEASPVLCQEQVLLTTKLALQSLQSLQMRKQLHQHWRKLHITPFQREHKLMAYSHRFPPFFF